MPGVETALHYDIGTDQDYAFVIYTSEEQTVVRDITGWALSFMVKRKATDADVDALVTKTTGSGIVIAGTFNAVPATNTQEATVSIADTDTDGQSAGIYRWETKRTDAGNEARVGFGTIEFAQTVHRT
jgi:hypothetical protein